MINAKDIIIAKDGSNAFMASGADVLKEVTAYKFIKNSKKNREVILAIDKFDAPGAFVRYEGEKEFRYLDNVSDFDVKLPGDVEGK